MVEIDEVIQLVLQGNVVYFKLLEEICFGKFLLGDCLCEIEVVECLGVSWIFVCEVICQFEVDGLVEYILCFGVLVWWFDYVEVMEFYDMCVVLEGMVVCLVVCVVLDVELDELEVLNVDFVVIGLGFEVVCLNCIFYEMFLDVVKNWFLIKLMQLL